MGDGAGSSVTFKVEKQDDIVESTAVVTMRQKRAGGRMTDFRIQPSYEPGEQRAGGAGGAARIRGAW